jgi:hypothetical protein
MIAIEVSEPIGRDRMKLNLEVQAYMSKFCKILL